MDQSNNVEDEPILTPFKTPDADATPPLAAKPLAPVSFVGMEGEQHVAVDAGVARVSPIPYAQSSGKQHLRFWLDLADSAQHHDVELSAGRLFFFTDVWDRDKLDASVAEGREVQAAMESLTQREKDLKEEQESGNPNPLRFLQILGERQMVHEEKFGRMLELNRVQHILPDSDGEADKHAPISPTVQDGPGRLAVGESGSVCVKRRRTAPFGWMQLPIPNRLVYETVGTFTMRPRDEPPTSGDDATWHQAENTSLG